MPHASCSHDAPHAAEPVNSSPCARPRRTMPERKLTAPMNAAITPLGSTSLERVLRRSVPASAILLGAPALGLPQWCLGAGGVAQTMWNHLHGFDLAYGIKDLDLVYFDPFDTSRDAEQLAARRAADTFADLGIECGRSLRR